ncbi:Cation/H+ exchanger [Corchorus olitorius]|uniref:Cation/H+ exchanger n=1 Tax=Corchorus olitorius TaxID=93759 RepID=A0A1R3HF45_9ROSI|nr:Cation/H+ exchanger [Corchorus olitorius]
MANNANLHPKLCISLEKELNNRGIFYNGNPFEKIVPVFFLQAICPVLLSWALYFILRPLKQSKFVCNVLAGIILGPSVLGRSKLYMDKMFAPKEMVLLSTFSAMAAPLCFFILFIKMNPTMMFKQAKNTWKISLASFLIPFILTLTLTVWLRDSLPGVKGGDVFPIQFSVCSCLSFFIVITHSLDKLHLLTSELGQLATSITVFNEIVILLITIIGFQSHAGHKDYSFGMHLLHSTLPKCGLILFAILVSRPVINWIIKTTPKGKPVDQSYVIGIIVWTLLLGMAMDALGASFIPAAIVMGIIIPDGPPLGATIIQKSELFITEFFLPLFFVRIGYYTDLSAIVDMKELFVFVALILASYVGRLIGCYLFASSVNISKYDAIMLSLILSLQGIVELNQASRWIQAKLLDEQNYSTFVASIVVLNAIITPIIEIFYKPDQIKSTDSGVSLKLRSSRSLGTTSIIGELRIISCIEEEDNVPSILRLLEAMNPRKMSPICVYVIHLVPLATQTVPLLIPYTNHRKMFIKPNDSDNIMRAFLNYSKNSHGPVQIQPFKMVSPMKYIHEPICSLAESISAPLLLVPFFKTKQAHNPEGISQIFNTRIQEYARCTVGILVDRAQRRPKHVRSTGFSYNVAVVFLGGADDREALVFAARMSSHPNVAITVLRIRLIGKGFENERDLDESFFGEFKAMNVNNPCFFCHEMEAENSEQVMNGLRSLGQSFDLVVVGKRQGCNSQFEEQLSGWTEFRELGVIGDAIAQPDFCGGMMSVLVLRHFGTPNNSQRILHM